MIELRYHPRIPAGYLWTGQEPWRQQHQNPIAIRTERTKVSGLMVDPQMSRSMVPNWSMCCSRPRTVSASITVWSVSDRQHGKLRSDYRGDHGRQLVQHNLEDTGTSQHIALLNAGHRCSPSSGGHILDTPGWRTPRAELCWLNLSCLLPAHEICNVPGRQWSFSMVEAAHTPQGVVERLSSARERLIVPCQQNVDAFKNLRRAYSHPYRPRRHRPRRPFPAA